MHVETWVLVVSTFAHHWSHMDIDFLGALVYRQHHELTYVYLCQQQRWNDFMVVGSLDGLV